MSLRIYFSAENVSPKGRYQLKMILRKAVEAALRYEAFEHDAEVSITVCDNAAIKAKNKDFRQKDTPTDVLSFPMYEPEELEDPEILPVPLGDIVISLEKAAEQAEALGHSPEREISFLTVHSVLHLLGYDHERSKEEDEEMCARQKAIVHELYPDIV